MLDDWPLHARRNLTRRQGVPRWVPEATLEDELYEGTWNYPSVRYDEEAGRWRAWYSGVTFLPRGAEGAGKRRQFLGLLYAESLDGVRWEKPDPERRYKYLFSTRDERGAGTEWLATSPDGLRWTVAAEPW